MEENKNSSNILSKFRKKSAFKNPNDPLECWNQARKARSRQANSNMKGRTHFISNDSPVDDDKAIFQIQKKLEALSSVQTTNHLELKLSIKTPSSISPPRQLSARRPRKGVTYRPSEKLRHNIVEINSQQSCNKCRSKWVTSRSKPVCELCGKDFQGIAFELEFKVKEDRSSAVFLLGDREIPVSLDSRFKCIVALGCKDSRSFELPNWSDYTRVATPSFQLNTERTIESLNSDNLSGFLPGEISFSDNSKTIADLHYEIDSLLQKQSKVIDSPSVSKIREVCDSVSSDYSKLFKKISGCLSSDLSQVTEKCYKGFSSFFESCTLSLLKYISQLQDKNALAKDSEQRHLAQISSLTKTLQKFQENPQPKTLQKKLFN